jgi:hypothetical protein
MSASNDLDGDLLGAVLPRRLPIPARPGLVWLVADGAIVVAQVAVDSTEIEAVSAPNRRRAFTSPLSKAAGL